jgi:hypothetical protein
MRVSVPFDVGQTGESVNDGRYRKMVITQKVREWSVSLCVVLKTICDSRINYQ